MIEIGPAVIAGLVAIAIFSIMGLIVGALVGSSHEQAAIQQDAVKHRCAYWRSGTHGEAIFTWGTQPEYEKKLAVTSVRKVHLP